MFGAYRFVLSLLVLQNHLYAGGVSWVARDAVFSFYTLSGFLMTYVLCENYGFGAKGLAGFCLNRFLRLYPMYYAICLLVLLQMAIWGPLGIPGPTIAPHPLWRDWPLLAIIGHAGFTFETELRFWPFTLVYNAWSLNIEIVCYLLLAFYFGRSRRRMWGFLVTGVVSVIATRLLPYTANERAAMHGPYDFQNHYGVLQAGFIPFALGGLCYYYRDTLKRWVKHLPVLALAGLMVANVAAGFYSEFHQYVGGLYVSSLLTVPLIAKCYDFKSRHALVRWLDGWLGRLAYPVFLAQWAVAGILASHFPELNAKTFGDMTVFAEVTVLLSIALVAAIDKPVEFYRTRVKRQLKKPAA